MGTPGGPSPTSRPLRGPTAGGRTACSASATTWVTCASRRPCGTVATPAIKRRLFGLSNPEGNHGEDVKELYYYLDGTPTASYLKALYRYPQAAFPYDELRQANAAPDAAGSGVRAARHGPPRRRPFLRPDRRVRQGRPGGHRGALHGGQPRPGGGARPRAPHAVVPQHVELGPGPPAPGHQPGPRDRSGRPAGGAPSAGPLLAGRPAGRRGADDRERDRRGGPVGQWRPGGPDARPARCRRPARGRLAGRPGAAGHDGGAPRTAGSWPRARLARSRCAWPGATSRPISARPVGSWPFVQPRRTASTRPWAPPTCRSRRGRSCARPSPA